MFGFNYFKRYTKEELESLLDEAIAFQTVQAAGLFLSKITWIGVLVNVFWNAPMTTINKFVFGILFSEYPFTVYLFRELGFNIGIKYSSLMIGVSIFVFIMTGVFNIMDNVVNDIADALDQKQNNKEEDEDE
jgi:hypothetical protein